MKPCSGVGLAAKGCGEAGTSQNRRKVSVAEAEE